MGERIRGMRYVREISHNGDSRSRVSLVMFADEPCVLKYAPKYLLDNEQYALQLLGDTPYVPKLIARIDHERLLMEWVARTFITEPLLFSSNFKDMLDTIKRRGLRHGDLTSAAVIPRDNIPVVLDWAESRLVGDPRPDKRPEGDAYWGEITAREVTSLWVKTKAKEV